MKTHELAKALNNLAKILRYLPNQELDAFGENVSSIKNQSSANLGISLATLAEFSKFGKADWQGVILEFNLPIEIRPRDAARDVMGKILTYLAENHEERDRIAHQAKGVSDGSSELSSALSFLLSNG